MKSSLLLLVVACAGVLVVVQANEWATSRDQYCIERCVIKEKLGREAYVCYTVDGHNKEFRSGNRSESSRPSTDGPIPSLDNDDYPWDYCTPAKSVILEQNDDEDSEVIDGNHQHDDSNEENKGSGFNPGTDASVPTSLPGVQCSGPCQKQRDRSYKCTHEGSNELFYCSPDLPLERQQITSHNKVWCLDRCRETNTGEHVCRTLLGEDHCSPSAGFSTRQTKCISPCAVWPETNHSYLACKITEDVFEQCGSWDIDQRKAKALEYTQDHQVCAGPCTNVEGEMICSYAHWKLQGTDDDPKAVLYMMEGNCGPDEGMNWTTIGIIIGAVVGAIILIAVVGIVVSRKGGYNRASTNAA